MATVMIDTGPIEATSPITEVDRAQWWRLLSMRRAFLATNLPSDCRYLLQFVAEAKATRMWEQTGHADLDDLIARGFELKPRDVAWALDGLRSFKPTEAVRYEDAIEIGKQEHGIPGGKPGPGRGHKTADNISRFRHGTEPAYLAARLRRDAPDIWQAFMAGEHRSVRAAALAAGIVRPAFTIPADVDGAARALRRRFDADQRRRLAELLMAD